MDRHQSSSMCHRVGGRHTTVVCREKEKTKFQMTPLLNLQELQAQHM